MAIIAIMQLSFSAVLLLLEMNLPNLPCFSAFTLSYVYNNRITYDLPCS